MSAPNRTEESPRRALRTFLLFISPWLIGFFGLTLYPFLFSSYLSFTDYSVLSDPVYIGADNYRDLAGDNLFWTAVSNTLFFAAFSVPIGTLTALSLAILLNFNLRGKGIFRTLYFLPSLVPMVCLGILWQWLLNGDIGLINSFLRPLLGAMNGALGTHFLPPNWLTDPHYAKWGLIVAQTWTVGNGVVIYLAGLQDVPQHLYESAEIDGAGFWRRVWHITLPTISPVIYFNVVMSLIGSLQVFAVPWVIAGGTGGPGRSLLFIATYIYQRAFSYWQMGYAAAMSLILFFIILGLTLAVTKASDRFTHHDYK